MSDVDRATTVLGWDEDELLLGAENWSPEELRPKSPAGGRKSPDRGLAPEASESVSCSPFEISTQMLVWSQEEGGDRGNATKDGAEGAVTWERGMAGVAGPEAPICPLAGARVQVGVEETRDDGGSGGGAAGEVDAPFAGAREPRTAHVAGRPEPHRAAMDRPGRAPWGPLPGAPPSAAPFPCVPPPCLPGAHAVAPRPAPPLCVPPPRPPGALAVAPPPPSASAPPPTLASVGVPLPVAWAYATSGLKSIYPWQAEAISLGRDGHNLVYCAPTGGGKSLVAEALLAIRLAADPRGIGGAWPDDLPSPGDRSRSRRRRRPPRVGGARALYVVPYGSIAREKAADLARALAPLGVSVGAFAGVAGGQAGPGEGGGERGEEGGGEKREGEGEIEAAFREVFGSRTRTGDKRARAGGRRRGGSGEAGENGGGGGDRRPRRHHGLPKRPRCEAGSWQTDGRRLPLGKSSGPGSCPVSPPSSASCSSASSDSDSSDSEPDALSLSFLRLAAPPDASRPLAPLGETVAVATLEKANVAVSRLAREGRLRELCCVVVDELHAVGDETRGATLETMLAKLLAAGEGHHEQGAGEGLAGMAAAIGEPCPDVRGPGGMGAAWASVFASPRPPPRPLLQIVGMSATVGGVESLRCWLGARFFQTDFRPVPLLEKVLGPGRRVYRKLDASHADGEVGKPTSGSQAIPHATSFEGSRATSRASSSVNSAGMSSAGVSPTDTSSASMTPPAASPSAASSRASLVLERQLPSASFGCDPGGLVTLVAESALRGEPTLVFCAHRAGCESLAALLARELAGKVPAGGIVRDRLRLEAGGGVGGGCSVLDASGRDAVRAALTSVRRALIARASSGGSGAPVSASLGVPFLQGCAYHHAGLTPSERSLVEVSFRAGAILVLCATSTLAAGVNLPAKRVVVRGLKGGNGARLSRGSYLQMAGRAGRAGWADAGEAYLALEASGGGDRQLEAALALLTEPLPPVRSALIPGIRLFASQANRSEEERSTDGGATANHHERRRGTEPDAPFPSPSSVPPPPSPAPLPPPPPVLPSALASRLSDPLTRLLFECVACGATRTGDDVMRALRKTLAARQVGERDVGRAALGGLQWLAREARLLECVQDKEREEQDARGLGPGSAKGSELQEPGQENGPGAETAGIGKETGGAGGQEAQERSHDEEERRIKAEPPEPAPKLEIKREAPFPGSHPPLPPPARLFTWRPTLIGRAAFESGLPLPLAARLLMQLEEAHRGLNLASPRHLVYLAALDHPLSICDWGRWAEELERQAKRGTLPPTPPGAVSWADEARMRQAGRRVGNGKEDAAGGAIARGRFRRSGSVAAAIRADAGRAAGATAARAAPSSAPSAPSASTARASAPTTVSCQAMEARHARWAAACMISDVALSPTSPLDGLNPWKDPRYLHDAGIRLGTALALAQDAAGWLGMASLAARAAGWGPIAALCADLGERIAAGAMARAVGPTQGAGTLLEAQLARSEGAIAHAQRHDANGSGRAAGAATHGGSRATPPIALPRLDPRAARALGAAGLGSRRAVARAGEEAIAHALRPALESKFRSQGRGGVDPKERDVDGTATAPSGSGAAASGGPPAPARRGSGGAGWAAAALARRQARDLVSAARMALGDGGWTVDEVQTGLPVHESWYSGWCRPFLLASPASLSSLPATALSGASVVALWASGGFVAVAWGRAEAAVCVDPGSARALGEGLQAERERRGPHEPALVTLDPCMRDDLCGRLSAECASGGRACEGHVSFSAQHVRALLEAPRSDVGDLSVSSEDLSASPAARLAGLRARLGAPRPPPVRSLPRRGVSAAAARALELWAAAEAMRAGKEERTGCANDG